jgi:exopolysaccharide production protein ExoZ
VTVHEAEIGRRVEAKARSGASEIASPRDFHAIQILRALAALMVVVWHSHLAIKHFSNTYLPTDERAFLLARCPSAFNHLYLGVDIFFCISGFIMTMLVLQGGEDNPVIFMLRRITRIYPMYWLFTGIVIITCLLYPQFNVAGFKGNIQTDLKHVILSLLLFPEEHAPILGVGWTLVQEMGFYLFVFLCLLMKAGARLVYWIGLMSFVTFIAYVSEIRPEAGGYVSIFFIEFMFGAIAFKLYPVLSGRRPVLQLLMALSIYLLLSTVSDVWNLKNLSLIRIVGGGLVGFLLICGSIGIEPCLRRGIVAPLKTIGDSSYVLYLSHWLVLSFLGKAGVYLFPNLRAELIAFWHVGSIFAAVSFAYLVHRILERPLNLWLRRRIERASALAGRAGAPGLPARVAAPGIQETAN